MVTKSKQKSEQEKEKGRVKVGKLQLNKETVKNLTNSERRKIKGGARERRTGIPTVATRDVNERAIRQSA